MSKLARQVVSALQFSTAFQLFLKACDSIFKGHEFMTFSLEQIKPICGNLIE